MVVMVGLWQKKINDNNSGLFVSSSQLHLESAQNSL